MANHETEGFAVGIDLGTTNTVVACERNGKIELIPSAEGHQLHPSVVAFKPSGEVLVGLKARLRRIVDPGNTIFSAKRLIGQPFQTAAMQEAIAKLPYEVVEGPNSEPMVVTRAGTLPVIDITARLLANIKACSEEYLGHRVTHCVVTVPAHFTDGQRAATRQAAEFAGFEVLRILNEPTAAALAYGMGKGLNERVVVFDMGGGTFDTTILNIKDNIFEVIGTGGDPYLGGDDMDVELGNVLAGLFKEQHGVDVLRHRHSIAKTRIAAEQLKMRLSVEHRVEGHISELDYGDGGVPLGLDFDITRADLERVIAPIVDRAIRKAEEVLAQAGLTPQLIDTMILVGGATQVPLVRDRVRKLFGKESRTDVDPMLAIGLGAAIQATTLLSPPADASHKAPLLLDIAGHSLGIATAGKYTEFLISKNTPIPVDRTMEFSTSHDFQTHVDIKVCQGEAKLFENNHPLGDLRLAGLKSAPRGATAIQVSFLLDADGMLQVTARDLDTGAATAATLNVHGIRKPRDAEDD